MKPMDQMSQTPAADHGDSETVGHPRLENALEEGSAHRSLEWQTVLGGFAGLTGFAYFVGLMALQTGFTLRYGYTGSVAEFYSIEEVLAELVQALLFSAASDVLFVSILLAWLLVSYVGRLHPVAQWRGAWSLLVAGVAAHAATVLAPQLIMSRSPSDWVASIGAAVMLTAFSAPLILIARNRPRFSLPVRVVFAAVTAVGFFYFSVLAVGKSMPQRWVYATVVCSDQTFERVIYVKGTTTGHLVFDGTHLIQLPSAAVQKITALTTPIRGGFYFQKSVDPRGL